MKKRFHIDSLITLMAVGRKMLTEAYTAECAEEDYIALSLIHELRGFISRRCAINGFNMQEIQFLLDFICMQ